MLGIFACGAIAFSFAIWTGHRSDEGTFAPQQQPQAQGRFIQGSSAHPRELALQSEASLAQSRLPLYELKIAPEDMRAIEDSPFGNTGYSAVFIADGKVYDGVKMRARGSWSRSWQKKSLKILFDHQNPFQSHNSLNLNSAWRDPAFVREVLAYHVYAACGVRASRAQMVRLQVNGRFHGLYVEVEQVDKDFLSSHSLTGAVLYKAASRSRDADERDLSGEPAYHEAYTKETRKTEDFTDLTTFCHELAGNADTVAFFNQRVDLDDYVNYLAATALIQHWDGLNKNHYLACDRQGSGKWSVIPWDLDRTFGDHWRMRFDVAELPVTLGTKSSPGVTGWNRLENRFFSEPALRAKFLDRLSELLNTEFTTAKLFPVLDKLEADIAPAAELDRLRWPGPAGDLHDGIAGVKSFIERRRAFLQAEIPKLRQP